MNTLCIATPLAIYILGFIPTYMMNLFYEKEISGKDALSVWAHILVLLFWPLVATAVAVTIILHRIK